jgi:hypothetical protein
MTGQSEIGDVKGKWSQVQPNRSEKQETALFSTSREEGWVNKNQLFSGFPEW